jgi:prepilin-type N-terminal cleavage/methylation domain-containing protein
MKPYCPTFPSRSSRARSGLHAFTLPEIMVVMAIFSLLAVVLVSSQLFGMRMYRISETKLSATASGRKALNEVRNEVRSGKLLIIGNGDESTFHPVADNSPQIGNALQIYPSTDTNTYVRFYLDTNDATLDRITSDTSNPQILASYITNYVVFQAEDFQGNVLTNNDNNRVVHMTLKFYQWEFPIAAVGHGGLYDYYQLQTRITRRLIE